MGYLPVIEHAAELLGWAIKEGFFFCRKLGRWQCHQAIPIGQTGKQFAIPGNRACIQCLSFGIGDCRHHCFINIEQPCCNVLAAKINKIQGGHGAKQQPENQEP